MTADDRRFFIGEVAERSGVSRDTIRYYERRGLLTEPPRTASRYRLYAPGDVDRIAFVGQAQTLGLTLEEIVDVLAIVDQGREPCRHVRERLVARLGETRARIRQLRSLERRLAEALASAELATAGHLTCRCPIIESATAGSAGSLGQSR